MKRIIILLLFMLIISMGIPIQATSLTVSATPDVNSSEPKHKLRYTKLWQIDPLISDKRKERPAWISWSPDATKLAIVYEFQAIIRILDGVTGNLEFTINAPRFTAEHRFALSWSADGQYILGSFDVSDEDPHYGVIYIWKLTQNRAQVITSFKRPEDCQIPLLSWHVDKNRIMTVCWSEENQRNILLMWNISNGISLKEYTDRYASAWSPNGRIMITSVFRENDYKVYLVNGNSLAPLFEFPHLDGYYPPLFVSWSADSRYVAGISCNKSLSCKIWVWDAKSGLVIDNFEHSDEYLARMSATSFSINPLGTLVTDALWNNIYFWDAQTSELFEPLQIMEKGGDTLVGTITVASGDGSIQMWQIDFVQ